MAWENHYSILMSGGADEVSSWNEARQSLVFQNNGANPIYIAFDRDAWGDGNDFVIQPGAVWVIDTACPKRLVTAKGTAGDILSVLESFA